MGIRRGMPCLRAIAQLLLGCLRKTDLLARYGGEEFAVLLPETRAEGANVIAERVRASVGGAALEIDGLKIAVTVSVGLASTAADDELDQTMLLKRADLALYRAKAAGRDRVEVG